MHMSRHHMTQHVVSHRGIYHGTCAVRCRRALGVRMVDRKRKEPSAPARLTNPAAPRDCPAARLAGAVGPFCGRFAAATRPQNDAAAARPQNGPVNTFNPARKGPAPRGKRDKHDFFCGTWTLTNTCICGVILASVHSSVVRCIDTHKHTQTHKHTNTYTPAGLPTTAALQPDFLGPRRHAATPRHDSPRYPWLRRYALNPKP